MIEGESQMALKAEGCAKLRSMAFAEFANKTVLIC